MQTENFVHFQLCRKKLLSLSPLWKKVTFTFSSVEKSYFHFLQYNFTFSSSSISFSLSPLWKLCNLPPSISPLQILADCSSPTLNFKGGKSCWALKKWNSQKIYIVVWRYLIRKFPSRLNSPYINFWILFIRTKFDHCLILSVRHWCCWDLTDVTLTCEDA